MSRVVPITATLSIPYSEIRFEFTRSAGPGGQNVNKVATRVELMFDVLQSPSLTVFQKERVVGALRSRLDAHGVLRLAAQESRSQWRNRELAVEKFSFLLAKAIAPRKKRLATRPSNVSKRKRVETKKLHGRKKTLRRGVSPE